MVGDKKEYFEYDFLSDLVDRVYELESVVIFMEFDNLMDD